MFVAAYWWEVHPGKEDQFRSAWRRGTELIREKYGSLGSRLHREAREATPDWPVIPYASVVEQGAVRQKPVGAFAPSSPAAQWFEGLWKAIDLKLTSL